MYRDSQRIYCLLNVPQIKLGQNNIGSIQRRYGTRASIRLIASVTPMLNIIAEAISLIERQRVVPPLGSIP